MRQDTCKPKLADIQNVRNRKPPRLTSLEQSYNSSSQSSHPGPNLSLIQFPYRPVSFNAEQRMHQLNTTSFTSFPDQQRCNNNPNDVNPSSRPPGGTAESLLSSPTHSMCSDSSIENHINRKLFCKKSIFFTSCQDVETLSAVDPSSKRFYFL